MLGLLINITVLENINKTVLFDLPSTENSSGGGYATSGASNP